MMAQRERLQVRQKSFPQSVDDVLSHVYLHLRVGHADQFSSQLYNEASSDDHDQESRGVIEDSFWE